MRHRKRVGCPWLPQANFAGRSAKQVGSHEDKGTGGTKHQENVPSVPGFLKLVADPAIQFFHMFLSPVFGQKRPAVASP